MKDLTPQGIVSVSEILAHIDRDRYMSLSDACDYLSLSERTLRDQLPDLPHYRVGKKLIFRRSELDRWMCRHRETGSDLDIDKVADEALRSVLSNRK